MRRILTVLAVAAGALAAAAIMKNVLLKAMITAAAGACTGTKVVIDSVDAGITKASVRIKGFRMYNPAGFPPDEILADIALIRVDYDISALMKKNIRLRFLGIKLKEAVIIRNKNGGLNVNSLKFVEEYQAAKKAGKQIPSLPMRIDVFDLQIGKIAFRDFSAGAKPLFKVYDVGLSRAYRNVTSPQQVAMTILSESLRVSGLKQAAVVYGVAALTGAAVLPAGVAVVFAGKDSAQADFNVTQAAVFQAAAAVIREMGAFRSQDTAAGIMKATLQGCHVAVKITQVKGTMITVTVSARKYLLPRPQIAAGVLYEIAARLKQQAR